MSVDQDAAGSAGPHRDWRGYAMAVGIAAIGLIARAAITPAIGPSALPFVFCFPAVTAAAWYGGVGAGVAATLLSVAAANWWFMLPDNAFALDSVADIVSVLAFLASSGLIIVAVEAMHRARAALVEVAAARARAEAARTESRELLVTTLASIGDGVIVTDAAGKITFLNAEATRLTGWSTDDAIGQPLLTVFHIVNEDTREPAENPVDKVLRTGMIVGLANHTVLLTKDGRTIPIDDSGAPVRRGGGPILGVVLVFRDVTVERAADQARTRLAAIVEHSGDAILTKNLDGIVQSWNASAQRLFGYTADEVVGRSITLLIPAERLHEEAEILARLRAGRPSEFVETIRVTKDGRRIPVSVSVSPLLDADGHVTGASKIVRDISHVVAARRALGEEHERLTTTLESIGDAVIVTDAAGVVTLMNPEAERLTGWRQFEAVGRPLPEVFRIINEHTRALAENPVEKVLRQGTVVGLANHTLLIGRDGTEVAVDDSAAPIRSPLGAKVGVVLVFRDVTERRQAEKVAELNERRKDEFLAILAHELRNPLAPIQIAVNMLRKLGPPEPQLEQLRDIIDRQTRQLTRLLDDLLDVSRVGSGKIRLRKDVIALSVVLANAIETARPSIDAHGHELVVDPLPEPIDIEGDLGRLSQVFSNLLSNAAKFTEKGGRITITVERDAADAVVRVRDTGIGIAPNKLTHVFEMFAQVEHPVERGQAGLGVGLSLAKTLVELHDGRVEARSEGLGRGSEFVVRLPMAVRPAATGIAPASELTDAPAQQRRRVLVADDNIDSAEVLAAALAYAGHEVATVHDGPSAVAAMTTFQPNVVILDVGMPLMSGYEVAKRIRHERDHHVLLIAVTGFGQDEDKRQAFAAGFDHHLTKPIDLTRLDQLLRDVR